MSRSFVNPGKDRQIFRRTAYATKAINLYPRTGRGGLYL